jgi:hypothetical protein
MPTVLKTTSPIARKSHKCMFCGCEIEEGKVYHRSTNVYDGTIYDWITHVECEAVANDLDMYENSDVNGVDGDMFLDEIREYIHQYHYDEEADDIAKDWQLSNYKVVKKIFAEISKPSV